MPGTLQENGNIPAKRAPKPKVVKEKIPKVKKPKIPKEKALAVPLPPPKEKGVREGINHSSIYAHRLTEDFN